MASQGPTECRFLITQSGFLESSNFSVSRPQISNSILIQEHSTNRGFFRDVALLPAMYRRIEVFKNPKSAVKFAGYTSILYSRDHLEVTTVEVS